MKHVSHLSYQADKLALQLAVQDKCRFSSLFTSEDADILTCRLEHDIRYTARICRFSHSMRIRYTNLYFFQKWITLIILSIATAKRWDMLVGKWSVVWVEVLAGNRQEIWDLVESKSQHVGAALAGFEHRT